MLETITRHIYGKFKIVAMGDKPNQKPDQAILTWKVLKAQSGHQNHKVYPGLHDP
ncbi:hypothetical protein PSHT_09319 [Puccinia striiformis]|uniref:Uncharacterized protein n=3 Tax=Puccinia striiformis TaxID=27350 RepID=A0A0L0VPK4_9BASI|nr:hypothetical protein PSTG_05832 [Puccinia striiformis f. sp. tritici PST-78]POW09069.1 hypothetical protein PSHT_09319 [Puccinia striiformis]POW16690.1 hypothetical protein PSTT_01205 [Puccinia striiformis]